MEKVYWHTVDGETALALLGSSSEGLDEEEAGRRLREYGPNRIEEGKKLSPLGIFLNQFRDFMVLVLLAATLISGLLGEYTDAVAIIAIIIVNGILGFVQEFRAEKSLASLRELTAPTAHVLRGGKKWIIPAADLVPGDIVFLEAGDRVPADLRLLQGQGLEIEESSLTGESVPVRKTFGPLEEEHLSLGDRKNMAYMGTLVTRGKAMAVVIATGMQTEMGLIADLIQQSEDTQTPLQRRLDQLGKILVWVALGVTALVVVIGISRGHDVYNMFLAGVSLAVAVIPEGLPAIVTIALALGVQRMIRRRAIVRRLPAVETLGCATVICSDKTGTLTQNKMTVQGLWVGGTRLAVSGVGYTPEGKFFKGEHVVNPKTHPDLKKLLEIAVLCNNSELIEEPKAPEGWTIHGDPTEGALLVLAGKADIWSDVLAAKYEKVLENPFDSNRKMMSVVVRQTGEEESYLLMAKGAPDVLLDRCDFILWNGRVTALTAAHRREILSMNAEMAGTAMRNLAFAYRPLQQAQVRREENQQETEMVFVGLAGMIDPPREEVFQAIQICRRAGIRTVMITGDHQATAEAIARRLGILPKNGLTVSGADLYNMSDKQLAERADRIYVYARVSPEHKLRIVKALQARGHVVAMTGDGVNDAPAIKAADIGVAMGRGGTDVAKEASSLILADDNFATIVAAVEEGRGIYDNIRKFVRYLLSCNVGEIVTLFTAMLVGLPLPLVPIQILWVNLVTDGLPAIALGVDPPEGDLMERPPRDVKESIFAGGLGFKIISRGLFIGLAALAVFWLEWRSAPDALSKAQTMAFCTLVMSQLVHVFDCRSVDQGIFSRNIFGNPWLVAAVLSSVALMVLVLYTPALQPVFRTVPLGISDWVTILVAAAIPTFALNLRSLSRPARSRLSPSRG
ncbi:calcium-translocating P-type ATPase, SERCA-type [Kyrpidia sp.]|uniref:calcium-translocating P-type ATPase, SERCA-type n=1 Tax=Kyrpidia sp. TaxID=2073077 RepID=UPI002583FA22|nr:calcium-translocating P-type ATPase, SERCA-type [Kyrpidia sp.]MCL6575929.1 calcium-translocating P-type ATPase, SERCA-type [Kyrpidia sp.]